MAIYFYCVLRVNFGVYMSVYDEVIKLSKELSDYVIELRREIHMYPELAYEEVRTSELVIKELKSLGYEVHRAAKTGVIGILKEGEGGVVALRADMDALPVNEENDVPYKSRIKGKMHACGHDAHTAMLLGAAKVLKELAKEIRGTVKLIFQPGEEGGLGAKRIVEEGWLDDVNAIFGMHVWADLKSGEVGIKSGPAMASADAFKVVIKGKGGHAAAPHESIDPIVVAADLINAYQKIVSREINPLEPVVISVAKVEAGTTFNVIPEEAIMLGTIRTFNKGVRDYIVKRMKEVTELYSKALRAQATFELKEKYIPPTVNDPKLSEFAVNVVKKLGIAKVLTDVKPTMGAEDFAFYLEKVPGVYIFLGIKNEDKGIVYPHHHPRFNVDEDVLWIGTAIYASLAISFLRNFKEIKE